ncbi:hypothetical protein [Streptomyces sp. NPDC058812]|uniref:hypothetical protein n=1 Tax=unclassified Streptomyces TaxID=2593676 RepID=UPI0036C8E6A3
MVADGGGHTLLLQQVLAEPAWAKELSDEDRRLDLGLPVAVPRPRTPATADDQPVTEPRHAR